MATPGALARPTHELEGVLAHEPGHHLAGHSIPLTLNYYFALPLVLVSRVTASASLNKNRFVVASRRARVAAWSSTPTGLRQSSATASTCSPGCGRSTTKAGGWGPGPNWPCGSGSPAHTRRWTSGSARWRTPSRQDTADHSVAASGLRSPLPPRREIGEYGSNPVCIRR